MVNKGCCGVTWAISKIKNGTNAIADCIHAHPITHTIDTDICRRRNKTKIKNKQPSDGKKTKHVLPPPESEDAIIDFSIKWLITWRVRRLEETANIFAWNGERCRMLIFSIIRVILIRRLYCRRVLMVLRLRERTFVNIFKIKSVEFLLVNSMGPLLKLALF